MVFPDCWAFSQNCCNEPTANGSLSASSIRPQDSTYESQTVNKILNALASQWDTNSISPMPHILHTDVTKSHHSHQDVISSSKRYTESSRIRPDLSLSLEGHSKSLKVLPKSPYLPSTKEKSARLTPIAKRSYRSPYVTPMTNYRQELTR